MADVIPSIVDNELSVQLEALYEKAGTLPKDQFMRTLFSLFGHIRTPGILTIYECYACKRIALFARASDLYPMFWYQPEVSNAFENVTSIQELVEELRKGAMPVAWQNKQE